MESYIQEIINQNNVSLSQLNDRELSIFCEQCFQIITQFHNISIENFTTVFYNIAYLIIQQEKREQNMIDKMEIDTYNYYCNMEKELLQNLKEIRQNKNELARARVKILAKKYQPEQRSQDWYDMRYNMITASDVGAIIGISKYQKPKDIILKKCGKTKFTGNKFTLHGQLYEPIATQIYESRFCVTVHEFGLLQHETIPILGASPDGITTDGIMIEIKCPYTRKINGDVKHPKTITYYAQIQTQLEVCDLEECHFWECEFLIPGYKNYQEYLDDKYIPENVEHMNILPEDNYPLNYIKVPNDRRSSNGQEKGILAEVKTEHDIENQYIYPPFHLSTQEQLDWLNSREDNYQYFKLIFWKLKVSSNCIVMRDKYWFDSFVTPKIKAFWKDVEKYRRDGCEELMPKSRSKSNLKTLDLSNFNLIKNKTTKSKKTITCLIINDKDNTTKTITKPNKPNKKNKKKSNKCLINI